MCTFDLADSTMYFDILQMISYSSEENYYGKIGVSAYRWTLFVNKGHSTANGSSTNNV